MRYLQEILPYCPQFYTQDLGRELLAELKSTTQSQENVEIPEENAPSPQPSEEPKTTIELKIPSVASPKYVFNSYFVLLFYSTYIL